MASNPAPVSAAPSKLQLILMIIQAALTGLSAVPGIGSIPGLAELFLKILQNGLAAYQAETGQPLDLTKIPLEQPVP